MIYSRGKERHNTAAGTVSRVSSRVFKIRDGSPGEGEEEKKEREEEEEEEAKGPRKGRC